MKRNIIYILIAIIIIFIAIYSFRDKTSKVPINTNGTPQELSNTKWVWSYTELPNGKMYEVPEGLFVLEFGSEGSMNSSTDCNSISGSYIQNNNSLRFGQMAMTKKYCANSIENEYVEQLTSVESYSISNDELFLDSSEEWGIMVFVKQ